MTSANGDVTWNGKNQGKGAVELSRNMYKGSSSVVSTLCYSVQWDAALQFIASNPEHADYPLDSTGKGYYAYDEDYNEINPEDEQLTGSNDDYATNNIYDMAGNVQECTMEAYDTYFRVKRGGALDYSPSEAPAYYTDYYEPDALGSWSGFRISLYIK